MEFNQYSSIFWDFGGVITSSPFEAFNKFEKDNKLPENFLRKVNSTNHENNAWALLEQSKINQKEFDKLFFQESSQIFDYSKINSNEDLFSDEDYFRAENANQTYLRARASAQRACVLRRHFVIFRVLRAIEILGY